MGLSKEIIYVVDDEPGVRLALSLLLESAGFEVENFPSALDFLSRFQPTDHPSCLLLDVRMPGLNGLALQEKLGSATREIPIIFMTGFADGATRLRAMKGGAQELLEKPISGEKLVAAVRRALEVDKANLEGPIETPARPKF